MITDDAMEVCVKGEVAVLGSPFLIVLIWSLWT